MDRVRETRATRKVLSETNARALGFNRTFEGKGVVSERGGWGRCSSRSALKGRRVDEVSNFDTGGAGCTVDASRKTEVGVYEDVKPFE